MCPNDPTVSYSVLVYKYWFCVLHSLPQAMMTLSVEAHMRHPGTIGLHLSEHDQAVKHFCWESLFHTNATPCRVEISLSGRVTLIQLEWIKSWSWWMAANLNSRIEVSLYHNITSQEEHSKYVFSITLFLLMCYHDDVIKWKHFPR